MKAIRFATLAAAVFAASLAHADGGHDDGHGHAQPVIGEPGSAAQVSRTIQVDMADTMRFTPERIQVRQGETVRFVVRNVGQVKHELVLGSQEELQAHYELMKKNPEMEHDDPNQVSLAPGKSGEIVWRFTRAGEVAFGCLQPGHYEAGMKGSVRVAAAGKEGK